MLVGFGQLKHGHVPDWVTHRKEFLEGYLKKHGVLKCSVCGRSGLTLDVEPGGPATLAHEKDGKVYCERCWCR